MKAMVLHKSGRKLEEEDIPPRKPTGNQLGIVVKACGVCRTDLHVLDGDLTNAAYPIIPGHEIVGEVDSLGPEANGFKIGDRVGIPWLGYTCGTCPYCANHQENLCDFPKFTGYQIDGGFAEYTVADARYCFPLDAGLDCAEAAPLLCAGLIGYRSYRMAGPAETIGIYGFGAAAHILAQLAVKQGRKVYAFTKPGDAKAQKFALALGVSWAGSSDEVMPETLDAAIIFAPAGPLVPAALRSVKKGGIVVCGGIHMSDIPQFPYDILWGERKIMSVANLTRQDGIEFLQLAFEYQIRPHIHRYALNDANKALDDLRHGAFEGAAVLIP